MESVTETYWALADKADKKFARLQDVPVYGGREWDSYFHKAFQVYTQLWKFQQENRPKLVDAGLKRWEIGEIASRIGQLYYKYYQHTSDSAFLTESYIFYDAILGREYFKEIGGDASLANKNLRFYARFIALCLLLNRRDMANQLARQFRGLVDEYQQNFQGSEAKDWKHVLHEIHRFLKADAVCQKSRPLRYSMRLDPHPSSFPPVAKLPGGKSLKMKDAVLATYHHNEVKFAELPLDAFRFLQCFEWEPSGSFYRMRITDANSNGCGVQMVSGRVNAPDDIVDQTLPPNPHKYILYRPSIQQLLLVLATACEGLPPDCILLLYLSASGNVSQRESTMATSSSNLDTSSGSAIEGSNEGRGLQRSAKSSDDGSEAHDPSPPSSPLHTSQNLLLTNTCVRHGRISGSCSTGLWFGSRGGAGQSHLYPSDILPFTRRPLFIVVDSDNSSAFKVIHGEERGEPAALLLSPQWQLSTEERRGSPADSSSSSSSSTSSHLGGGNLFTFFLTAPLLAFCRLVGLSISNLTQATYEEAEKIVSSLFSDWGDLLSKLLTLDLVWARVLLDPFLRQVLLRFVLCRACLVLHKQYGKKAEYQPHCLPLLPEDVSPRSLLVEAGLFKLATSLNVADRFMFSAALLAL